MSNPPRPPPPLHPPASQWRLPQVPPPGNGPWNFQPPPMYPSPISPFHPAFPPNVPPPRYPHPPNVPPLEVPPPNVPFASVPLPNLPPAVGMPIPVGIPPRMLVDPGFPPPNLQVIPPDLRFPVPGMCPMPEGQPPKDPRMVEERDKDFHSDQPSSNYLLYDSNEENHFAESNSDIDIYAEMNASQEETGALNDFPVEAPDELRSKIFHRASDILVRKKLDEDIFNEIITESKVGFHSDQSNPSLDQEESEKDTNKIHSADQIVDSDLKKRSTKSKSPRHGNSLNQKSSSSNRRTSSHLRDRARKSPSHSKQDDISHSRDKSGKSRKSPSQSKQNDSSDHRNEFGRSRKSPSQSKEFPNHPGRSHSRDRFSRNRSTRDYKDVRDIRRISSRYDKTGKEELSDSRGSLGHRRSHEDRFSSRSKISDDSRNRSNEIDKSSAVEHQKRSGRDAKSSRSYRDRSRRDYNSDQRDSGYRKSRTDDRDSKSQTNGSSVKSSGKDKITAAASSSDEDNPLKSPKKAKCVNPKLKLYDNIWRKVRDKKLTSSNQIKLTVGKLPLREKAEEEKECDVDEENSGITEKVTCSDTKVGDGTVKPTKNSEPQQKDQSSKPNGDKASDSRIVKRKHKRSNETGIQPCLSCEPSKFIETTWAGTHYSKSGDSNEVHATEDLKELHKKFEYELIGRGNRARARRPKYEPPKRKIKLREHKPAESQDKSSSSSSCSEGSSSEEEDTAWEELEKKRNHPDRLHPELWFNDPNEMNDGPLCRCSAKARRTGIRHGIYVGEGHLPPCDPHSNNAKRLYHYKICVKPVTNFLTKTPTYICYGKHMYVFEGFSMFSHYPLPALPHSRVIRFNYEYTLMYVEEPMPENFTVAGLELFTKFLFREVLELVDLDWKAHGDKDGCPQFHFMPRFARRKDDGKVLLSMHAVLEYLLKANKTLIDTEKLPELMSCSDKRWQEMADKVKGMIVTCPGMKPSSVRVDQLDREHIEPDHDRDYPVIVHFGVRPPQLSYAGNPLYQKAWRNYVKYRHLLANKPKVKLLDRHKLAQKELKLQEMRMENDLKRDVTVVISSKGFYKTGLMSDMVQHAMLIPIIVCHLRFHASLTNLEQKIGYKFEDRFLLQLALTHPSYRENFGTNPDHARNSLTNCGLRQPEYGDRRIHYMNTRKRGINTLINIMSRFGREEESPSRIHHNERLEFLGDAVVEFLSSTHLFYMFPDLEEGGLATYRAAIVQNQHLALLAKKLELGTFMLYAHGSDLCHDLELRHAMANCFEALMGALFLDAGIEVADKVFSNTLFPEPELKEVWMNYPLHPLQEQEPDGDRRWIESIPLLQKINDFEEKIGIEFTHIRLLARALTHRSLGYNNLTLGSNQRLEFLGDTVLQLVASEYLYKFFPQHHEGHLSLLRSSLVNNRTQAVVCGDLGMVEYAIYPYVKVELKPKDKADLLEAFLGALYIDKDLGYCRKFCEVCFFPRLQDFIMNQDWNDPKSKLQQCCLTLRSMDGGEPDIPTYKVIECKGPTNTRVYGVAVYFQGNRLAVGEGHSIQQAEMDAAGNALAKSKDLFPQLKHQKRAIERSLKQGSKSRTRDKRKRKRSKSKTREK